MKKLKLHLIAVFLILICSTVYAQGPSWNVNPNQYIYSMTLTGKVTIDGAASIDENDIVAAFIDGECRGVANVTYQEILDEYFVFLMIYSNDPSGTVSLKIYDSSDDKELNVSTTFNFSVNGIVGSVSTPFDFSILTQDFTADILSFTMPNQDGSTSINSNSITLKVKSDSDLSKLTPTFTLSDGAKAYVDGTEQVSGTSTNDFRVKVSYKVISKLGFEHDYLVIVSKVSSSTTDIRLSNASVAENKDSVLVGTVNVVSTIIGSTYTISLVDVSGSNNSFFYLKDDKLYTTGSFNHEVKSTYKVNVKVDNNSGVAKQQLFTINVLDENDAPKGISLSVKTLSETTGINNIVARLNVTDEDKNDSHSFQLQTGDGNNDLGNSYFEISGDSLKLIQALNNFPEDSLRIFLEVTDAGGETMKKAWSFGLVDINFAPQFVSTPLSYAVQNQVYVYPLQVNDNESDPVSISFENLPSWLVFNAQTMLLSGVPNNDDVGLVQFVIGASDGHKEVNQAVIISVLNINDAPEIKTYPAKQFFVAGTANTVSLPADCIIDPDLGDVLSFSLSTENNMVLPPWLVFDAETLTLSGSPSENDLGEYILKLTAIDQGRLKEWVVFSLEVTVPTAIDDNFVGSSFKVYPNPVSNALYFGIPNGKAADISISNLQGQLVKKVQLNGGTTSQVSLNDLLSGIYLVKIHQGIKIQVEQIVKQ